MYRTFTLKGRSSNLSANFYPPIDLDPGYSYSLSLIGFHTFNSIPNIEAHSNNKFYFKNPEDLPYNTILIPTGSYEVRDIAKYLQRALNNPDGFTLKPNNNTLKCEIESVYDIDFRPSDSIGRRLGFTGELPAGSPYQSDSPVNIISVSTIRIECNIITGSYYNDVSSHTLYEFAPTADPGFQINIEPHSPIHLPLGNLRYIDNISLNIVDQNSIPVNFRGEEIVVRLLLRRDGPSI